MKEIHIGARLAFAFCALPALFLVWKLGGNALDRYFTRKFTVLNDMKNFGKPRPDGKRIKGTAVICGGSIAGLWTARVAADHFEDVLIVEAESWTLSEEGKTSRYNADGALAHNNTFARSRVMQYQAIHGYQPLTLDCLRACFPDVDDKLRSADARIGPFSVNAYYHGRRIYRYATRLFSQGKTHSADSIFISREGYELLLRKLVLGSSHRIRTCAGLVTSIHCAPGDLTTVNSVAVRTSDGKELIVPAALVVDCTGPSRNGLKWLRRLAVGTNEDTWDNLKEEYQTNQFCVRFTVKVPEHVRGILPIPGGYDQCKWLLGLTAVPGEEKESVLINRLEGHRILVHLVAWGDTALPESLAEVEGWIRHRGRVCPQWIFDVLRTLVETNCEVERGYIKYPACFWVHYDRAPYMPSNFIAIGDSVVRLNPLFGQGCTKAAMGAVILDALLRRIDPAAVPMDFSRTFFYRHTEKILSMWKSTKAIDYLNDTTVPARGEKRSDLWLSGVMTHYTFLLAGLDDHVDDTLYEVSFFRGPPTRLYQPSILIKMLLFVLRSRLQHDD